MKQRRPLPLIIYLAVLALAFSWVTNLFSNGGNTVPYSDVLHLFQTEQVKSFLVEGDRLKMELYEPYGDSTTVTTTLADPYSFRGDMNELFQDQYDRGILTSYDFIAEEGPSYFDLVLPLLIVGLVILFLWAMIMGKMSGAGNNPLQNFGKARTVLGVPDGKKVTFDDVAGADEEKAELQEVVDFLRNPEKFTAIGARIPHGMLLVGPPGTGKTLLARAVAGEAGVQFLSISEIGRASCRERVSVRV